MALILGIGHAAMAQQNDSQDPNMVPSKRLEVLTQKLQLTPDQVAQVKPILNQMAQLKSERSNATDQQRKAIANQRKQQEQALINVLTPDQATKYNALKADERNRRMQNTQQK